MLEQNWQTIRDEGLSAVRRGPHPAAAGYTDIGFNSFFRTGWKRFYLNWYGDFLPSAKGLCPKTTELLAGIPSVRAAMFAILPPGSTLVRHRDPFAGSLRYHLGLKVPQDAPSCRIFVDGQSYYWKDGEAVMFDETYIHYAENLTDETPAHPVLRHRAAAQQPGGALDQPRDRLAHDQGRRHAERRGRADRRAEQGLRPGLQDPRAGQAAEGLEQAQLLRWSSG